MCEKGSARGLKLPRDTGTYKASGGPEFNYCACPRGILSCDDTLYRIPSSLLVRRAVLNSDRSATKLEKHMAGAQSWCRFLAPDLLHAGEVIRRAVWSP